jgi:phage tail-like protein
MPDLMTTFSFVLEVGGVELASFKKCSGFEAESEVIEYKEATADGKMIIRKAPGSLKWNDLTLERRADNSKALWEWHKQVEDGDIDGARRDGSIVIKDSQKKEVARWNFERGWPCKWSGPELDASGNEIATEKIVITHEGLHRG